jgi:flavin reductase (DIM6/NTAB) family NADH-FMN oxidoreductase RutF
MAGVDQHTAGDFAATVSAAELRRALGHLPTRVTVVTSLRADGEPPLLHWRGRYVRLVQA